MKKYMAALLAFSCLTGCISLSKPMTRTDLVGTWQCESSGLLSSTQTLQLQEDGLFSYHSTDTIVGLEMKGKWRLEENRIRFLPEEINVRGKPDAVLAELSKGFLSQPVARRGGKLVLQIDEGDKFERLKTSVTEKELR